MAAPVSVRSETVEQLSLRARLVVILLVVLTLALAVSGGVTVAVLRDQLMRQVDRELIGYAQELRDKRFGGLDSPQATNPLPRRYQVWAIPTDGRRWKRIGGEEGTGGRPDLQGLLEQARSEGHDDASLDFAGGARATVRDRDNPQNAWRVVLRTLSDEPRGGDPGVSAQPRGFIVFAMPLQATNETINEMVRQLILLALVVLSGCAMAGVAALRGAFAPLRKVESVTAAFAAGDTSQRVPSLPSTTEVGRLGGAVNSMLDQIETTLAAREASEARMRRFVGDASHELRTPLVSVRGFAELYRHGALADEASVGKAFERIEGEAKRMGGLVEDLLLLARLDEQRPLNMGQVDLCCIASDVVHDAAVRAPDRSIRLVGAGGGAPGSVLAWGDDERLRQVVTNLVSNAVRHTPTSVPIEVSVDADRGVPRVRVVDHGPGVPADQAARIFERFFRADASRQRATGGSGLGLAIVASIVAAHQGQVWLSETPGGGATFEVTLPARGSQVSPS